MKLWKGGLLFTISGLTPFVMSAQNRSKWFEFYPSRCDSAKIATDMSATLNAPAEKHGFLQVASDCHFRFENKTTFKTSLKRNDAKTD